MLNFLTGYGDYDQIYSFLFLAGRIHSMLLVMSHAEHVQEMAEEKWDQGDQNGVEYQT